MTMLPVCSSCPHRSNTYFCAFPEGALRELERHSTTAVLPDGAAILVQGEAAESIAILCEGRARISATMHGRTMLLHFAGAGEVFGLLSVMTSEHYTGTVRAAGPATVRYVRATEFQKIAREYPDVCQNAVRHLAARMQRAETLRMLTAQPSVTARLVSYLSLLATERGRPTAHGTRIPLDATLKDLAQMLGTTRETLSRALSSLERDRVIVRTRNAVYVTDEALQRIVSSD